jgi:hypothetical protein
MLVPPWHNPVRVAEDIATLDVLSTTGRASKKPGGASTRRCRSAVSCAPRPLIVRTTSLASSRGLRWRSWGCAQHGFGHTRTTLAVRTGVAEIDEGARWAPSAAARERRPGARRRRVARRSPRWDHG